jgi:hypothetical protein
MPAMMELLRAFGGFTPPDAKDGLPALGHVIAEALPGDTGARTVAER